VEVKRDSAAPGDAVRVMTIHGAKGLEAPLVVLADATHDPAKAGGTSSVVELPITEAGPVPVIRPRKDECAPFFRDIIDEARNADQQEHWRLAYVGLTRAAERLVIAGVKPKRDVPDSSWHRQSAQAMERLGAGAVEIEGWGSALVWESKGRAGARSGAGRESLLPLHVPDCLRRPAPEEARPPRPLAPSQIADDRDTAAPPSATMRDAARRGTLLHALFERLPGVAPGHRRDLALRWLERAGVDQESARREIADSACSLMGDPQFTGLFGSESLAEAPIAATLPDGRVVAGTVDRLCIGQDLVRVVDFKTGRSVPSGEADVPPTHRAQMEAYAAALSVIFPGRRIEAALLYTSGPKLITLPVE